MATKIPLGPFELRGQIGKGGMGSVWAGLHVHQGVPVAVKILTRKGARREAYRTAFGNEVRAVAALDHPAIVTVLDYGAVPAGAAKLSGGLFEKGSPYIVMELATQGNLKDHAQSMGWRQLRAALVTILDGLGHAHGAGVVHRDLKPANILVGCGTPEEGPGLRITDFGLAHASDDEVEVNPGWGTPHYMAPEQFRGAWRDYGPWTDLYAVGVMAFELACGIRPFNAESSMGFAKAHSQDAPRPFEPRFEVPERFEAWLARLLHKRPADRFRSAADAAWALQRLGEPTVGRTQRGTVALRSTAGPRPGVAPRVSAEEPVLSRGTLRSLPNLDENDIAQTQLDRAETTQLLEGPDRDTQTFEVSGRSPVASVRASAYFESAIEIEPPPVPPTWRPVHTMAPSPRLLGAGLGLIGLRTVPIVDRDAERDRLWELLRDVRESGKARAVLIRGAAGTGKSRLAAWLARRAQEVGAALHFRTAFSPIAGPGDGLSRIAARYFRAGGLRFSDAFSRIAQELAHFGIDDEVEIRALTELVAPVELTGASEALSFRLGDARQRYGLLLRLLQRTVADRAAIVLFDDIQWGADAIAFTQYVLERQQRRPAPILFVLTARDEALVSRPVETSLVADLAGNRRTSVIDLEPLDERDTMALVRELLYLRADLADEVGRRSHGNPLFAVQLVGDWVVGGKLEFGPDGFQLKAGVDGALPDDIHQVWRERLSLLLRRRTEADRLAIEVAAALGNHVMTIEWESAAREAGTRVQPTLVRDLLESGLAVAGEGGWTFCHGLLRESLERDSRARGTWEAVSGACAGMLGSLYPGREFPFDERLANHLVAAGRPSDAIAPLLRAARSRIDRSDFEVALDLLNRRERLMHRAVPAGNPDWGEGWVAEAQIALWLGHYERAQALAAKAGVEARRHGWPSVLRHAQYAEAVAFLNRGEFERARRAFTHSYEDAIDAQESFLAAEALLGLGRVSQGLGEFDEAVAHFDDSRARMATGGSDLGIAQCLNALGDVARDRGAFAEARGHSLEAKRIFETLNNSIGVADCINDLAELSRLEGDLESAARLAQQALGMYEALGSDHSMHVRTNLALVVIGRGDFPAARQMLDEVRERFGAHGQDGLVGAVDVMLLPCLAHMGEFDLLRQRLEEAEQLLSRSGLRNRDLIGCARLAAKLAGDQGRDEVATRVREFARRRLFMPD